MSQESVEALRRASEQDDPEALIGLLAEDVVWDLSRSSFPEARVYHGHDGVREWFRGLEEAWANLRFEADEITDLGGDRVLMVTRPQGHGHFTKIDVDYRFATVWTFRDGKVVRMDRYDNRTEALEAAGLSE